MFVICKHLARGERGSSLYLCHYSTTKESWYPYQRGSSCGPEEEISEWHQGQINVFSVWHDFVTVTQHSSLFMILVPWKTTLGNLYSGPFEIYVLINRGNNWWSELSKNLDRCPDPNVFSQTVFPHGLSLGATFWWFPSSQCWSNWAGVRKCSTALSRTRFSGNNSAMVGNV